MIQKEKIRGVGYFLMALAAGLLPFAAPDACAQALREGLALCGGPLLLSLFPFLIVSTLLIQCPAADVLGLPFCPAARLIGVRSPAAGRVLLIGSLGGFAPAASAAAGAVRSGQLTAREADALLPACVCSGPSFVILAVGQSMLGSAELGVLLFLAQVAAGYLSAALLARLGGTLGSRAHPALPTSSSAASSCFSGCWPQERGKCCPPVQAFSARCFWRSAPAVTWLRKAAGSPVCCAARR